MKLQLAPFLSLEGKFETIPIKKIYGLPSVLYQLAYGTDTLCPFPPPIVRAVGNARYALIHQVASWATDISGNYSNVACFVLAGSVTEEDIQRAMTVLHVIHSNRANQKLQDVFRYLKATPEALEIILLSYGIKRLREVGTLFSPKLISDRTIRRIDKQLSTDEQAQPKKSSKNKTQEKPEETGFATGDDMNFKEFKARLLWPDDAQEAPKVWDFDKIINSFPNPDKAKERLIQLILENPNDLKSVWETVKKALIKKGKYHE